MASSGNKVDEELIVWPWKAIVANIPVQYKDDRYAGVSGRKLKEDLVSKGYNLTKVHPLWNHKGHSGFAIVEFDKGWDGFKNALTFEKSFEMENHGKRDWYTVRHKGDKLYSWIAREEEYCSKDSIGAYLCKNGDLKTISDIEIEEKRTSRKLVSNLANKLEVTNKKCEEIKGEISRIETSTNNAMQEKEEMIQTHNAELKMQKEATEHLEKQKSDLEIQRQELEMRERRLREFEALIESKKRKLDCEKKMNEVALLEQRADESLFWLAENHKREKEEIHRRIRDLEKELTTKQALEVEIQRMRGAVQARRLMSEDGDQEAKKKMESIEEDLKKTKEILEGLEARSKALIIAEQRSNDELQDARRELINGLRYSHAFIGVNIMGELDDKPFRVAANRKYLAKEAAVRAWESCLLWEQHLEDPSWHPFKIIAAEGGDKEVIDEEDDKIKYLKQECGDKVYEAVTKALEELNEYNPNGQCPVPKLWNRKERRKAKLAEGIAQILKQWKQQKKRYRRRL